MSATSRPVLAAVLLAGALVVLPAAPAEAHLCSRPIAVTPGEPSTIHIGVPAEMVAVTSVTVVVPDGFRVDRVIGAEGWQYERTGADVQFTGGRIVAMACGSFALRGVAAERRTYVFPMTVGLADGTSKVLDAPYIGVESAQLVYAGTEIPAFESPGSRGGRTPWATVGVALLAFAAAVAGARWVRGRPARR